MRGPPDSRICNQHEYRASPRNKHRLCRNLHPGASIRYPSSNTGVLATMSWWLTNGTRALRKRRPATRSARPTRNCSAASAPAKPLIWGNDGVRGHKVSFPAAAWGGASGWLSSSRPKGRYACPTLTGKERRHVSAAAMTGRCGHARHLVRLSPRGWCLSRLPRVCAGLYPLGAQFAESL